MRINEIRTVANSAPACCRDALLARTARCTAKSSRCCDHVVGRRIGAGLDQTHQTLQGVRFLFRIIVLVVHAFDKAYVRCKELLADYFITPFRTGPMPKGHGLGIGTPHYGRR